MDRHALLAAALVLNLAAGCSAPPQEASDGAVELAEGPVPRLEGAEPAVRRQIEDKLAEIEGLRAAAAGAGELSQAYGDLGLLYLTYSFIEAAEVSFANARSLAGDDYRWPYLLGYLF